MVYRPFRSSSICQVLLAACVVSLGAAGLNAQTAPSAASNPSRVDIFTGYSYFGAHGEVKPAYINYSSVNVGAIGSGAYFFTKYIGAEGIFVAHPNGTNDGLYSASVGPIVRAPMQDFTLFAHALVGGARLGGPNSENPATLEHEPYEWGVGLTAGGGMDYALPFFNNRFSLRLFQADFRYVHEDYGFAATVPTSGVLGGRANLNGVDLSTGIVTHFGHIMPPPPVAYTCSVAPTSVFPGDPITATGVATNVDPKKTATYSWTSTGGTITGTSTTANIDTKGLAAGSYKVSGHVSEGPKAGQSADCMAEFSVKAFEPPTLSCSANPSTVNPGDSSTITAMGMSPQNRPLTYSYSATAGSITGTSSTATLSTAGAAPGTITITCNTVDDKGQTATATTSVSVLAPPAAPAPKTSSLCSVSFERDARRPTRVDNEAKACLDDVALNLQRSSDAKLALVGSADPAEKKAAEDAAERAVNTKAYLVGEKGIDGSRISVYTSTMGTKTVSTTLIPAGATLDTTGLTPVDESAVKAVPRNAPPKKHHKK